MNKRIQSNLNLRICGMRLADEVCVIFYSFVICISRFRMVKLAHFLILWIFKSPSMLSLRGPEFEDKVAREGKLPPIIQVMERGRGSSNPLYSSCNEGEEAPNHYTVNVTREGKLSPSMQVMKRGRGSPTHHTGNVKREGNLSPSMQVM